MASQSLYQKSISLIEKLYAIPGLKQYMFPNGLATLVKDSEKAGLPPIPDPTAILWHTFRLGAPLCIIADQLGLAKSLDVPNVVDTETYNNVCKKCVYYFIQTVKQEAIIVVEDRLFTISDLYKNDIGILIKV